MTRLQSLIKGIVSKDLSIDEIVTEFKSLSRNTPRNRLFVYLKREYGSYDCNLLISSLRDNKHIFSKNLYLKNNIYKELK